MTLLPGWAERLRGAPGASAPCVPVRLDPPRASTETRRVGDSATAEQLVQDLRSTPLSAIAVCTRSAGSARSSGRPTQLGLAAWLQASPEGGEGHVLRSVFDLDRPGAVDALAALLRLRTPLVVHNARHELQALLTLGIDVDGSLLFDVRLAAAVMLLGSHHPRSRPRAVSEAERIEGEIALADEKERLLSLEGLCERYGLTIPGHNALAARADAALRVYVAQQPDLVRRGLLATLYQVEFPCVAALARTGRKLASTCSPTRH